MTRRTPTRRPNALPVQLAGADGRTPGLRAVPSLRYLQTVPPFSEHCFENDGDDSIDAGPTGGRTWDGRAGIGARAGAAAAAVAVRDGQRDAGRRRRRLRAAPLRAALSRALGRRHRSTRPADAVAAAALALEVYQQTPADVLSVHQQVRRRAARPRPR